MRRSSTIAVLLLLIMSLPSAWADELTPESELATIIEAAKKNPLARAAQERTRAALAQEDEAAGYLWPSINATSFLAPSPEIRCDNAACTQTSPNDVRVNVAGLFAGVRLDLTQPLYTAGKIDSMRGAAKSASRASAALEDELAGEIATLAAKAYFGYLLAQELLWMLEEGAEHIESGRQTLEKKLKEGSADVTVQDRFRIQSLQAEVGARIADAQQAKTLALAGVRALLGEADAELTGGLLEPLVFNLKSSEPGSQSDDPKVRAAQHGVAAQRALESFEKRSFLPSLALVGGLNIARAQGVDDAPSAFARDPFNTTSAYVALTAKWTLAPMVQHARLRRRQAQRRQAVATHEAAQRLATLAGTEAMSRAQQAKSRLDVLQEGERAGKAWVASVLQADAIGAASAKDLADAYVAYFAARGHVLESVYQWNLAVYELRRRAGEFSASY